MLLINTSNIYKGLGNLEATAWLPHKVPHSTAMTPHHYKIEVAEEKVDVFEYKKADIVGLTASTAAVNRSYQISEIYHKQGISTVIGGIHESKCVRLCSNLPLHCHRRSRGRLPKILENFEARAAQMQYKGSWKKLDILPLTRREILFRGALCRASIKMIDQPFIPLCNL